MYRCFLKFAGERKAQISSLLAKNLRISFKRDLIKATFQKEGATVDTTHLLDLVEGEGVAHFLVKPVLVGLVAVFFLSQYNQKNFIFT